VCKCDNIEWCKGDMMVSLKLQERKKCRKSRYSAELGRRDAIFYARFSSPYILRPGNRVSRRTCPEAITAT
jgi:hypothetical protein